MGETVGSITFNAKAKVGSILMESFYKKLGKKLGAKNHKYKGKVDIAWASIDTGKKETLILLHGFSDRKENFYFTSKKLKDHFNIIIPDLPGFGKSMADPTLEYRLENYCDWLTDFIENNDIGQFHLAGSSLGGAVAALLAINNPDKVLSLSLVGTAGFYLPGKKSIYDETLNGHNIFQITSIEDYEILRDRVFKKKAVLPGFVKAYMAKDAIDNHDWYGKIFNDLIDINLVKTNERSMEEVSLNASCRDIKMPTLLMWGRHDTLFPFETAEFLKNEIPNAKAIIFDDFGHVPHVEGPESFARELSAFIKSSTNR